MFEKVSGSIVILEAQTPDGKVQGSGVVYDSKSRGEYLTWEGEKSVVREGPISYVVTNAHVVENARSVLVLHHGATYKATVEWADDEVDLASLIVCGTALPATAPYSAAQLKVGERVFAIGSPLGLENSISEGIISGKRPENGVILLQTTAAISHGSSGGGLFDVKGRLVGITTFKIKGGENLNFATDAGTIDSISDTARNRWEAKALLEMGDALSDAGKYREAIEAFSGAIERDPKNAATYYKRGNVYRRLDNYRKGIEDVKIAAQLGDKQAQDLFKSLATQWTSYLEVRKATHSYLIPKEIDVVCRIENYWKVSLKLDYANKAVNGIVAAFTDSSITWIFPLFPEDFEIDKSGERKIGSAWVYFLDRRTGSLNIGNVLSGQCSSAGEHQF